MGRKLNWYERQAHLAKVASLYLRGTRQADIARELHVHHTQITYDLKYLADQWRRSQLVDLDTARAAQLERLDELERTAYTEWERSRTTEPDTMTEQVTGRQATMRARVTTKKRFGNADYLVVIQWCIAERSKLLGLYPKEGTGTNSSGLTLRLIQDIIAEVEGMPEPVSIETTGRLVEAPDEREPD